MLDSAIAAEYNKVTFIHGVGNGVLKNAIIEALKDYKNTENRMASIAKFGVGAKEPESFILSIKLRVLFWLAKLVRFWKFRTFVASKSIFYNLKYWILIV